MVLACLTTAISQINRRWQISYERPRQPDGKLSYKVLVMIVPIVTTIVASFRSGYHREPDLPLFSFFYPITAGDDHSGHLREEDSQ